MKVVVVIPTYNEKENIKILIPQIEEHIKKIKNFSLSLLVVDDNSPDNTAKEVKKLMKKYKNLYLLTGKKEGLGKAYLRGFDYAIKKLKADVLVMMDADLSHPAELIPKLLKEIENGYDLVIGSRYIKNGSTPDWNFRRRLISRIGNLFARLVAGLYNVHDCTSGFRAFKVSLYNKTEKKNLHTRGYSFLTTLLLELCLSNAKIKEIPLVFYDRKYGESKLKTKDIVEFFINSFRLRFRSSERLIKFMTVGASGILVNLGIFSLAKSIYFNLFGEKTLTLLASSLTGDEISIIYNFLLNHFWTFKKSTNESSIFVKLVKFHIIAITSVLINNTILLLLVRYANLYDVVAKFIGILVAFLWNYFVNVKWTWREKIE